MDHNNMGDTTYTKIFIGGLAWATQRDSIKRYFVRFGPIIEAVVIFDKHTRKSKGYGFVTFKYPDSAMKACQYPNPVIDGRRTNCNLAAFGSQKNHPTTPHNHGSENLRSSLASSNSLAVSTYICENIPEVYTFPYSGYRHPYPSQDIFLMNYDNSFGVGYYVPLYTLQRQSVDTKMTENSSQIHVYQPILLEGSSGLLYETGPNEDKRMVATSEYRFSATRHNSSA